MTKADPRIIAELELVRRCNRTGDNPNLRKPRMVFNFDIGKICIEGIA